MEHLLVSSNRSVQWRADKDRLFFLAGNAGVCILALLLERWQCWLGKQWIRFKDVLGSHVLLLSDGTQTP